jgi:general secretion pathway protein G
MKPAASRLNAFLLLTTLLIICVSVSSCGSSQKIDLDAKEHSLRYKLDIMRDLIKRYNLKEGAPLQSLEELVRADYIGQVPVDPITEKNDWQVEIGFPPNSQNKRGIVNVRSSSSAISSEGTPYNQW